MPITFTKEEIKEFLDEQGFDVDDERTLDKFIHDLKKLIKFEEMQRRRRKLGHPPEDTLLDSTLAGNDQTTSTEGSLTPRNSLVSYQPTRRYQSPERSRPGPGDGDAERSGRTDSSRPGPSRSPQRPVPPQARKKSAEKMPYKSPERNQQKKPGKSVPPSRYYESTDDSNAGGWPSKGQRSFDPPITSSRKSPERSKPASGRRPSPPKYDDSTSSYEPYDSTDAPGVMKAPLGTSPPTPPQQLKGGHIVKPTPPQRPILPPKKPGNRLVMKRITAVQTPNGESMIEESDIDYGPVSRRPFQNRPPTSTGRNRPGFQQPQQKRPQTAPVKPSTGSSGSGQIKPGDRRPSSSNQQQQRPTSSRQNKENYPPGDENASDNDEDEDCDDEFEPDELFHALNELIFPEEKDSTDTFFSESDARRKKLLKPPPHVAVDPVALYHWYKNYNWDIYKIPGEDRHMQLRWNVRAYTVGGYHPCVEPPKYRSKSKSKY